jgi:membrane-associated phospholipid phosphatase
MYRGMHHPTDVLIGALLGVGALMVAAFVVRRWTSAEDTTDSSGLRP